MSKCVESVYIFQGHKYIEEFHNLAGLWRLYLSVTEKGGIWRTSVKSIVHVSH